MQRQHSSKTQNAIAPPQTQSAIARSSTHPIEELQSAIGNQAVNQLLARQPIVQAKPIFRGLSHELVIQPKLTIGAVGDKYEQEADCVAERVVSHINTPENSTIQRQEMLEDDDEQKLRMKPVMQRLSDADGMAATPELETSIRQESSNGRPLDRSLQTKMEPLMGVDLSQVSVHTNSQADRLNCQLNSRAFTWNKHIFFKQGEYNPSTPQGQELIAHESAHVVQQTGNGRDSQTALDTAQTLSMNTVSVAAPNLLQRRVLTIGDAQKEQEVGPGSIHAGAAEGEGSRFLANEKEQIETENEEQGIREEFYAIPDKWGDRALRHRYGYFHEKRRTARSQGTYRYGPRRSFQPKDDQKYLESMGEAEDLKIVAHGGGDRVGGYTPAKLVKLLRALGFQPKHKGIIWLRGCLAAYRPPKRFGSQVGTSFIEQMDRELRDREYTNEVYGLRHLAISGNKEEEYDPEKYAAYHAAKEETKKANSKYFEIVKKHTEEDDPAENPEVKAADEIVKKTQEKEEEFKPRERDRIWYKARPYSPVRDAVDEW